MPSTINRLSFRIEGKGERRRQGKNLKFNLSTFQAQKHCYIVGREQTTAAPHLQQTFCGHKALVRKDCKMDCFKHLIILFHVHCSFQANTWKKEASSFDAYTFVASRITHSPLSHWQKSLARFTGPNNSEMIKTEEHGVQTLNESAPNNESGDY